MPFTFAHPGFVMPLQRRMKRKLSVTGLVAGSIAPDMDIILRLTNQRFHLFEYDLFSVCAYIFPISVLFAGYFHTIIRNILIDHLPESARTRFAAFRDFRFMDHLRRQLPVFILSVFLGIYTHILLDVLTHFDANAFQIYGGFLYQSWYTAQAFFYGAIYLPNALLTFWGFYLILDSNDLRFSDIRRWTADLFFERKSRRFFLLMAGIAALATVLKTIITGLEQGFYFDSLVINTTNGVLLSVMITPALCLLRNKIKK